MGNDITCKILAFIFGLLSEIEATLISQRTTDAITRLKSEGFKVGRPFGSKSKVTKLSGKEEIIIEMRSKNMSLQEIAKKLKVSKRTLCYFIAECNILIVRKKSCVAEKQ